MQLTEDLILRYVAGQATEEEVFVMDSAMVGDRALFTRVRCLFYLRDHFDMIWRSFGSAGFGQDLAAASIAVPIVGKVNG